jgi:hypothetical protein
MDLCAFGPVGSTERFSHWQLHAEPWEFDGFSERSRGGFSRVAVPQYWQFLVRVLFGIWGDMLGNLEI